MAPLDTQDLYSEAGELFRHYLSWREKLLGGYIAVIAALAVAVGSRESEVFGSAMAILAMLLTVVFWLLERRNRKLFLRCIKAGVVLEKGASLNGPFTELNKEDTKPTHSNVLDCFFSLSIIALFVIAVLLWRNQGALP